MTRLPRRIKAQYHKLAAAYGVPVSTLLKDPTRTIYDWQIDLDCMHAARAERVEAIRRHKWPSKLQGGACYAIHAAHFLAGLMDD